MAKLRALKQANGFMGEGHGAFTLPGFGVHYAPDLTIEPTHLQLQMAVDLEQEGAVGQLIWTFHGRRDGERQVELDAVELNVEAVTGLDGYELTWRHDGKKLFITWNETIARDAARRVSIEWTVDRPRSGMFFGCAPGQVRGERTWMVTDNETERARYWLPCIDLPNVRTPVELALRSKSEHTRLGPGKLVREETNTDGTTTSYWQLEQKAPSYLICLAVGDFCEADGGEHDGVSHKFFAPKPYTPEQLQRSFGPSSEMMKWMTARLGVPFPYPKYYQFAAPGVGGAMENISLTTWDDVFITDAMLHAEWGWLVDLINLHEMAHSYFGDAVVCRDFAHAWLKEGWATYMESVWLGDTVGEDALHLQMYEESLHYRNEADNRYLRPIMTRQFNSSFQMYDGHLYPGAAWRVHMLRHMLGESDFWTAVNQYLTKYSGQVVETDDFRLELEAASGLSLARYFDQWIHSPGYPKLKCAFKHNAATGLAQFEVEQTQMGEHFGQTVGVFSFDLEIAVESSSGDWQTFIVSVDGPKAVVHFAADEMPKQVVVDPEMKVLHALDFEPGQDLSLRSVAHAPTIYGRIQAADVLMKNGNQRSVDGIKNAYGKETRWGLKRAYARALGRAGTQSAMELLIELLNDEQDVRVMSTLTEQLGRYRDEMVVDALTAWLDRGNQPYGATSAALKSLGLQRGDGQLERLKAAAQDTGWWGWTRRAARIALGHTRTRAAFDFLLADLKQNLQTPQVELGTVAGLADASAWLTEAERAQAAEALIDSASGRAWRHQVNVAQALTAIGDSAHAGAIDQMATELAPQWAPMFARYAQSLRKKGQSSGADSRAIEELKGTIQKLTARLDVLESQVKVDR